MVGSWIEAVAGIDEGKGELAGVVFEKLGDEEGGTGDGGRGDELADGAFGERWEAGEGVAFSGAAAFVSGGEALA